MTVAQVQTLALMCMRSLFQWMYTQNAIPLTFTHRYFLYLEETDKTWLVGALFSTRFSAKTHCIELTEVFLVYHQLLAPDIVTSGRFHLAVWGLHRSSPLMSFCRHHSGTPCRWCGDSGNDTQSFHPIQFLFHFQTKWYWDISRYVQWVELVPRPGGIVSLYLVLQCLPHQSDMPTVRQWWHAGLQSLSLTLTM